MSEPSLICECCGVKGAEHWMEWGEWLCSECASQAIEEDANTAERK
jgi:hypothetical protein